MHRQIYMKWNNNKKQRTWSMWKQNFQFIAKNLSKSWYLWINAIFMQNVIESPWYSFWWQVLKWRVLVDFATTINGVGKLCRQFMFSHGNIKEEPPHATRTNTTFKLYRLHCPFTIFHWFAYSFDAYFNFVLDEIACMLYSYCNGLLSMLFISSLVSCMCSIISYTGFRSIERTTCAKTIATPYTLHANITKNHAFHSTNTC